MHVKRRRLLPNFETCSVALFASLALYGPLPAKAQTATPSARSVTSSSNSTVPSTARRGTSTSQLIPAQTGTAIPPNRWTPEQLSQAFKQTDSNGDGKLSREEAAVLSGLSRQFDRIDANKDGSISSAEFDEALK